MKQKTGRNRLLLIALPMLLLISACGESRRASTSYQASSQHDTWQDSAVSTTTKIKVITSLNNSDLKDLYIPRVLKARFSIDAGGTYKNHLSTSIKRVENYYMQVFIDFQDSTAILYGRYGNLGLNAIATGEEPSSSNINWKDITYNSRGWELLHMISGNPPGSVKKYNR